MLQITEISWWLTGKSKLCHKGICATIWWSGHRSHHWYSGDWDRPGKIRRISSYQLYLQQIQEYLKCNNESHLVSLKKGDTPGITKNVHPTSLRMSVTSGQVPDSTYLKRLTPGSHPQRLKDILLLDGLTCYQWEAVDPPWQSICYLS